jgi:CRP/FNR family cyclic AMP-dependent transcriptional regulator
LLGAFVYAAGDGLREATGVEWTLLRGLSDDEVEQVMAVGRPRRFARREVVWHDGDRADTIHLIRSGRIAVRVMTSLGEVATVAVWGPGDAAGIVDVHGSEPFHVTSALALQPTETMAVRVDDLTEIRRRLPAVNDAVIRLLSDKIIDLVSQLVDAHYVPADTRVLRRLSVLSELYDRGDDVIVIPLTQEDIAEVAGVTRPTVNRVLKKEEKRGTLRLARGTITVTDKARLAGRSR